METASPLPAQAAPPRGPEMPLREVEPLITTHRIFAALDGQKKSLQWLHADLFDSRVPVTLSALQAVGALADPRSISFLAKLVTGGEEEVRRGAARALGRIRHPRAVALLEQLVRTARGESVRREILEALADAAPAASGTIDFLRQTIREGMVSPAARAHAAGLLLKVGAQPALEELLTDTREEVVDQVLLSASESLPLLPRTVSSFAPVSARLSPRSRAALVTLAARQQLPESAALLDHALCDAELEVRRAAYAAIGTEPHHAEIAAGLIDRMAGSVEASPALEDEVQQALLRLQLLPAVAERIAPPIRVRALARVGELYKQLAAEGRHVSSDTHELGWLITRAKEYVEYYCDEEFKAALVRWLKGAGADEAPGLLRALQATAVRVEVRHFDGYTALAELIKNPRRPGIALVAREIALAKTGKGLVFSRLVRAIRIACVFLAPAPGGQAALTMRSIFSWARQEKLFRLAEAALLALARVDGAFASAACRECLALPPASKVLAIASLHLLRELDPQQLEPSAARLLASLDDTYVTLNAIETISTMPPTASAELARALLARVTDSATAEVRASAAAYLGEKVLLDISENLKELVVSGSEPQKAAALAILERRVAGGLLANPEGMAEFLFRILRGEHAPSRRAAALILWKMGDDYAPEVLGDSLTTGTETETTETLRSLRGTLREPLLPALSRLLTRGSASLHEALRDLLLGAGEPALRESVLAMALRMRGAAMEEDPQDGDETPVVDLRTERTAFQFEREHIQEQVMFFSDIQGYSKKAQLLTPLQLSTLIQEYEKVLLAHVDDHRGELVKRMGDGHMIVFRRPLDAVLAAVRLQKSMVRFNRYREENTRVVIRIGIHAGKVIRKPGGDVLGNEVNIASRLESSARPGSILISDRVYDRVKDAIHAREIGRITVKNIAEPIRVFEPYEITLDLPAKLDPLKQVRPSRPAAGADAVSAPPAAPRPARGSVSLDPESWEALQKCFSALALASTSSPASQTTVASVARQILARWETIRKKASVAA